MSSRIRSIGPVLPLLFAVGACDVAGTHGTTDPDNGTADGGAGRKVSGGAAGAGGTASGSTSTDPHVGGGMPGGGAGATGTHLGGTQSTDGGACLGGSPGTGSGGGAGPGGAASPPVDGGAGGKTTGAEGGPGAGANLVETVPESLRLALSKAEAMDANGITQAYPPPTTTPPAYDAKTAQGMDLMQASKLALDDHELAALSSNGLVISKRQAFPSFAYGYKSIYAEDLPVYVSADSILEAVHRTFDTLLKVTEESALSPELAQMFDGIRASLSKSSMDPAVAKDADLYIAVAASLLKGQLVSPVAGADASQVSTIFGLATAASGHQNISLFGVDRDEDFSQFTPRGHYTENEPLKRYFRAMMWLGRVDLRLVETQGDGTQAFHRRQFDAAVALRELLGEAEFKLWDHIDSTIGAYVGEHDSMTPKDLDGLMKALGVTTLAGSASLTDEQIVAEIQRGGWGAQRIASRIIIKEADGPTLPLDRSFLLFGQRFTVDSYTFVNVTYDRVARRLMPNPLDAAFAAFGNNAALPLLSSEFTNTSYVQGLAKTRTLIDAHETTYWEGSLYTRWLGALRSLSPQNGVSLPGITHTTAWDKRILSAQLGSWAELRHDTILYVKQSYTTGASCQFPDAYVDPYPEFYARLGSMAEAVGNVVQGLPSTASSLVTQAQTWVSNFKSVAGNLQKMAENQQTGTPHSSDLLAFINDAVKWDEEHICGEVRYKNLSGWYLKLYFDETAGLECDPVVADVHTQSTDEAGNDVGRILHVGTGIPRLMIVTAETCEGPRAYAGLASSYGELIMDGWKRLNDEEWASKTSGTAFPDPAWMSDVLAD